MRLLPFLVATLLLCTGASFAQPSAEKHTLAQELVRVLRLEQSVAAYLEQCKKPKGSPFDPMLAFRSEPGSFGGISPQSAYWPEVKAVYAKFQATACSYATSEKLVQHYIERLAADVSEEDLRAAIAFNRDGPGSRVQDSILAANGSFQPFAAKLMYQAYEVAMKDFQRDIRNLVRRYREEPK